jgi:ribosomal protein S3AE
MAERKKYIDLQLPILDETPRVLGTPESLHNKTIKLDLTRQLRGRSLTIKFRIFNNDGKLIGLPNKMELVKAYIRRMARKRTNYVEDSFRANCADIRVTVKPLLITRKRVSRAVRKNLRNTCKEFILDYLKQKDYNEICQELLDTTFQKALLPKLKKVYPLSFCDLRIFETIEPEKIDIEKAMKRKDIIKAEEADIQEIPEENSGEKGDSDTEKIKEKEITEKDD